jgi:hypothetical protein
MHTLELVSHVQSAKAFTGNRILPLVLGIETLLYLTYIIKDRRQVVSDEQLVIELQLSGGGMKLYFEVAAFQRLPFKDIYDGLYRFQLITLIGFKF